MRKYLPGIFAAVVLGFAAVVSCLTAYADADDTKELLRATEIMHGDENGNFDDNGFLTREQFAKITVAIADADYIPTNSAAPFFDVPTSRWSSGYIDRANVMGFFHGYPDGSFRPDEKIVPEQICKIMLKLLGYENENITGNWAQAQISFAKGEGLLDGVSYEAGVPVTRIEAAKIIENTLFSQLKDSDKYLVEVMGYGYFEDTVILTDKNVQAGYVSTSNGVFKKNAEFSAADIGKKGDLITNKKGEILCFAAGEQKCKSFVVKTASGNSIAVFGNEAFVGEIAEETPCYYGGQPTNFAQMKLMLKTGDDLVVAYSESGVVEYISSAGNSMQSPAFIGEIAVNENTSYIRDGIASTAQQIDSLDICYYLEQVNTVVAYSKRITGVFENAYPSKENISSITLSGKQYTIGHINAVSKLSSAGNIRYGDTITLLFGKDDTVADVITLSENQKIYGVVMGSGLKERTDENGNRLSEYVVSFLRTDGTVSEYSSKMDYDGYRGRPAAVTFRDGFATVSPVNTENKISGLFDWEKKTLGKYALSEDVDIIDVCNDSDYSVAKAAEVFPQRIDGAQIYVGDVLYAEIRDNKIASIILHDYTKDLYDFGIMLYAKNLSSTYALAGEYKANVNGRYFEFVTQNQVYNISSGQPAGFEVDPVKGIIGIRPLTAVQDRVTGVDALYAYTKNGKYLLDDDVIVYSQIQKAGDSTGYRFDIISAADIDYEKTVTAYFDKTEEYGGRIRVIVVK